VCVSAVTEGQLSMHEQVFPRYVYSSRIFITSKAALNVCVSAVTEGQLSMLEQMLPR